MLRTVLALITFFAATSAAGAQVLISTCGAVVPAKQVGILQNDLDCGNIGGFCPVCTRTGCALGPACQVDTDCENGYCRPTPAVVLEKRARLDMAGHSISAPGRPAVQCGGFFGTGKGCVVFSSSIDHGEIKDSDFGIFGGRGPLEVRNLEVRNCREGILTTGRLTAIDTSSDSNHLNGFTAKSIVARNVSANDNVFGSGFVAGFTRLGKPGVLYGGKIRGVDVTATGNGTAGVFALGGFILVDLVATGNGFSPLGGQSAGIIGLKGGHLLDSTVTGNVNGPANEPLDVFVTRRPGLFDTTCGKSGQYPNPAVGWGVCSGD